MLTDRYEAFPTLSVLMLTYNHERYIRQAVESVLSQETSFPIELVVGEDCSTDSTRSILLDFQRSHPDRIRLLLHENNIGAPENHAETFDACRGEFVAFLDGDDYWTDSTKLQRQVDALVANPHWSMCFHVVRRVHQDGSSRPKLYPRNWTREEAFIEDLIKENFMSTCSIVFRNCLFGPLPPWQRMVVPGDWATSLLNAEHGPIGFVPGVMADYRIHDQGVWSQKEKAEQIAATFDFLSHVDHHFKGKYREQIDAHRIELVSEMAAKLDELQTTRRKRRPFRVAFNYAKHWSQSFVKAFGRRRAVPLLSNSSQDA